MIEAIVGILTGAIASMGLGGGFVLMIWLTGFAGLDQRSAQGVNLLFFLPSAIVASIFRWKQGKLEIKKILPAIITGCISAGICAWFSTKLDISLLKKLFGGLLLITGVRELLYRPRNAK